MSLILAAILRGEITPMNHCSRCSDHQSICTLPISSYCILKMMLLPGSAYNDSVQRCQSCCCPAVARGLLRIMTPTRMIPRRPRSSRRPSRPCWRPAPVANLLAQSTRRASSASSNTDRPPLTRRGRSTHPPRGSAAWCREQRLRWIRPRTASMLHAFLRSSSRAGFCGSGCSSQP